MSGESFTDDLFGTKSGRSGAVDPVSDTLRLVGDEVVVIFGASYQTCWVFGVCLI